jgi:hypothetical protein
MRKIVLTFGLIAGAIMSAMLLLALPFQDRIGFDKSAIVGYTSMVMAFLMTYFGVRSYRDTIGGGTVTFGKALVVGLAITAVASVCYVITWEVIFYGFTPDFADQYAAHALEKAQQSGASAAQLAAKTEEMNQFREMYRNPLVNVALTLLEPLPVGLVFTLMSAGILSRKRS